jgi:hypothetical protein
MRDATKGGDDRMPKKKKLPPRRADGTFRKRKRGARRRK